MDKFSNPSCNLVWMGLGVHGAFLANQPNSTIHKAAIRPAAIQNVVWRAFQPPAPFMAYGGFRNCTRKNHGMARNHEASSFVNSTVMHFHVQFVLMAGQEASEEWILSQFVVMAGQKGSEEWILSQQLSSDEKDMIYLFVL